MDKDLARFLAKVRIDENGCWIWTAAINKQTGYGAFGVGRKVWSAHKYAYTRFKGEVSSRLHLDHSCEVRACCNPEHVRPKTPLEHIRRHLEGVVRTEITHCPYGHEHSVENTYVNKKGCKICRTCRRQDNKEWRERVNGKPSATPYRERTHCPYGHPYDEENTYWFQGRRACQICRKRRRKEWKERNGSQAAI